METVREQAKKRNVYFSKHAREQQEERSGIVEITDSDVYRVLEYGSTSGAPIKGKNEGEWKLKVSHRQKGARGISVITIVVDENSDLFIKTIMWDDKL